ncbi:CLUMA_CG005737, isoform A [Clunio marinus]|uniref:CLUMA_CG005737, isoform A n=1 Tax=Clunio marinus TaxID=568069 RepID=A0A1J1HVQ6_9DIPT|nr:CLUMA_CG005737, isoform A [Clunio marinus]
MEQLKNLELISNSNIPEEQKAKIVNEISEVFDVLINNDGNQSLIECYLKVFMNYLKSTQCQFFSESPSQKVRKTILEMIHRLPVSEMVRPYVNNILILTLSLIKEDNEENVLICLRIIIDLHKQYRPAFYPQIKEFLLYIKMIYCNLPNHMDKIFDPRFTRLDTNNVNINDIYTVTDKILPLGRNSFKVLQELPIILVLMYQLYKQNVHENVVSFLPAILNTITLEPRREFRAMENFNKELFVDFMGAQIKTLAFLAYTIKTFSGGLMEIIEGHAKTLVDGMFSLLRLCLKESAHLRKELLVATRHILATNLRTYFVPSIELLFDEDLLLGRGYTTHESLRPLAYSTLGDFIHHVRQDLKFDILVKAVNLFSKNIHDETLPTAIQIMSIRLLLNLVDCIRVQQRNDPTNIITPANRREVLVCMLKVFTLKFHTIAKVQMPIIIHKWKLHQNNQQAMSPSDIKDFITVEILPDTISKLTSIGFTPPATLNIAEYRLLIKSLISGVKTIIYGINFIDCGNLQPTSVMLAPQEVQSFIDFFNWSIESFYLYRINSIPTVNGKSSINPAVQREEKELLELFSGLFLNMTSQNFQEIFTGTIGFLIQKMIDNQNLQVIINTFLSYRSTSPLFATVMVEYLLERMEEIGSADVEKSNLYLKLFKLIFGSVSMFNVENEPMIRPYLQKIVLNSMEMAMRAEEPFNYFLLLRALFRSIGGGTYDMLYQEFLPLLPNLLGGLNRLQSGCHKQHMKDLFVELCLTVPVRLSSLLPFLPMLMDPLVSALNGSPMLVTQGLRTLELCVDNLLPDFFYDHIQPVRAELMQALWKTMRSTDNSSMGAFRILGKFGGGNRNMLIEPQKIEYQKLKKNSSAIKVIYAETEIKLPVHKIIEFAYSALKNTSSMETFYLNEIWNVVRCYLATTMDWNDDKYTLYNFFTHHSFYNIQTMTTLNIQIDESNEFVNTQQVALTAMFEAASNKELRDSVLPTMIAIVRQYTLVAIAQQAGPFKTAKLRMFSNPLILINALVDLMGNEEKEVSLFGQSILSLIIKTSTYVLGTKENVCKLPMMQYLGEKIIGLCYGKSWYAKKGGCFGLRYLCEQMSMNWINFNIFPIIKAHLFIIRDLSDDVCSGTIDLAMSNIEFILNKFIGYLKTATHDANALNTHKTIVNEFVLQTPNPHKLIRQIATKALRQIATIQKIPVATLLEPFKNFFTEMIVSSQTKTYLRHQPLTTQIGILEANHFVTSLEPKLMKFDNYQFLTDVKIIIKCDDDTMSRFDAYKDVKQLPELRETAMKVLVSWHYIYHMQHYDTEKVKNVNFCEEAFVTLFKAMESYPSLQDIAFDCLKRLTIECKEKSETGWPIQNSLDSLGDYMSWTLNSIKRLSFYSLLYPKVFTEKTCEQLLEIVKKLLQNSITANKDQNYLKIAKTGENELKIASIIELFHQIPAATSKYVVLLLRLVLATEEGISLESSSPYRGPLMKFLIRYPEETVNFLMTDEAIRRPQFNRFMIYLLKHKDGATFKNIMESKASRLQELIINDRSNYRGGSQLAMYTPKDEYESRHQAVLIVHTLIGLNDQWLPTQMIIVNALNQIWTNELQKVNDQNVVCDLWHLIAKILLHYFEHNPADINLLYQLLKAFNMRFVPDFQFLRDFLHNIVCENYTVDWKRNAFFLFVDYFGRANTTVDLKIKILTMIIIPSFAISFEKGEENRLIRGVTQDEESNVISVFINKIVNPFMMKESDDGLRIALLQFACLLVERASAHIHSNKKEDIRLLTTFGYSSLLHSKNYWDPTAIYNGHLLLSHIIARLANKKSWQEVVFKVFHSLLKAHAIEARHIVRQTLEVFMPMMPLKLNESNVSLINLTKSVIIKDGYAILQLYHVFQVIIRHHTIYYPVRHQLIQNMISSMQRLESSNSVDYRKLAIDIAEVIINWELRRIKESTEGEEKISESGGVKRSLHEVLQMPLKKQAIGENSPQPGTSQQIDDTINKPIEWNHCKSVINFLFDLLFLLSELVTPVTMTSTSLSPNEVISKLSLNLLKKVLKKDVWIRPEEDLQFTRFGKVFEDPSRVSSVTICNFLEIFIHLLDELDNNKILSILRSLQPGLAICVTSTTTKVLRLMSTFLSKVISLFPVETYINYDDLRFLYQTVEKTIRNGLEVFEKDNETPTASFFGTFLILKTAFSNNSVYFEKFVEKFTRFVALLKSEHINVNVQLQSTLQASTPNMELTKEMLLQSLQLLKNHLKVMSVDTRKTFINLILVELIEKSNDPRIIKTIIQVIDSWFKMKNPELEPTLREKILLLQKLTHHIESRFSSEASLNILFLELILMIYSDPMLNTIDLTSKLDQAFLSGLRSSQSDIRQKFFKFFDKTVERNLYDRLLYILSTKAWDSIGNHYWIKQCIELLILSSKSKQQISNVETSQMIPSITAGINFVTPDEVKAFYDHAEMNQVVNFIDENEIDELIEAGNIISDLECEDMPTNREEILKKIINSQLKFLKSNRDIKTEEFLSAAVQLCHLDSKLAESVWIETFPRLWTALDDNQKENVTKEVIPFLSAGTKVNVKESHISAVNTFTQSLTLCDPPVFIPPSLMRSLSKAHNLWHRMALVAEDMTEEFSKKVIPRENEFGDENNDDDDDDDNETLNEIIESLSSMYTSLREEDMWAGLWKKHAKYSETNAAIFYEQMGYFDEAQIVYETIMFKCKQEISNGLDTTGINAEIQLWQEHWIRCTKELNDWNLLISYGQRRRDKYAFLLMDCAWRISDWNLMKQNLSQVEQITSKLSNYKLNLYNGYVAVLSQKENPVMVGKHIELASLACLQEWRRLPNIVSHIHIPILQVAQQIMELQEASQIHQDLQRKQALPFHDMKSIVKTWKNRLPIIADDLTHWNDIFTWRQHHYQLITESTGTNMSIANLGSQASSQATIQFGKIARKQNMLSVAQKSLREVENIILPADCYQKIIQNVKCLIQQAQSSEDSQNILCDGLKTIESCNIEIFQNDHKASLYAYKGYLYTYLSRSIDANKSFSHAVDLCDSSNKAWGLYGEYLEMIFQRNPKLTSLGVSAMTCFFHAARDQSETKTRKFLAKVIWLLTYEETRTEMLKVFESYMLGVPTLNWLSWIPQLLNCLVQYESVVIMNLLNQIAKIFPQAVYFPIRTLYLMLKLEQRERHKCIEQAKLLQGGGEQNDQQPGTSLNSNIGGAMKSTSAMWRCSKIMQLIREFHPTVVCSLEGILDQLVSKTEVEGVRWFRENAFEENLHQLKQGLEKFYAIAFDNRGIINQATITQPTLNLVKKLVSNFTQVSESTSEVILLDPVFTSLRMQFASGFDFVTPENNKLLDLINRLKACIKVMEAKVRTLPKSFVVEEKYRFLSNFSQKAAEVDLPGELLLPRHSHYNVKIARFMPLVEIVQKHNTSARRLYIQGTNGKIYPYLVVNDSGMIDARREERILQLFRMLNSYLAKTKETSKRFLNITVPRVVAVLPQMRLVEDDTSSISLLDVFKNHCASSKIDYDAPIMKYYKRLGDIQKRGAHNTQLTLSDIFKDIQTNTIPKTVFKDWATRTFNSATDYWTFRKMFTLQLSLCCILEYAFHLTRLNADMMYLHQDSGLLNVSYFKFDLDDVNGEFNKMRPVPFRLTPNIVEFLTNIGISGPLQASVIATARCFLQPNFQLMSILRTILRDEIITIHRKQIMNTRPIDPNEDLSIDKSYIDINAQHLIKAVSSSVAAIKTRLSELMFYDQDEETKISQLITKASSHNNLSRMDPAFHPWF